MKTSITGGGGGDDGWTMRECREDCVSVRPRRRHLRLIDPDAHFVWTDCLPAAIAATIAAIGGDLRLRTERVAK